MHDDRRVPRWDPLTRELWVGDLLVKPFRQPADNQERVLAALEEEGWPRRIDDPCRGTAASTATTDSAKRSAA